jgi:hypothetical protein
MNAGAAMESSLLPLLLLTLIRFTWFGLEPLHWSESWSCNGVLLLEFFLLLSLKILNFVFRGFNQQSIPRRMFLPRINPEVKA